MKRHLTQKWWNLLNLCRSAFYSVEEVQTLPTHKTPLNRWWYDKQFNWLWCVKLLYLWYLTLPLKKYIWITFENLSVLVYPSYLPRVFLNTHSYDLFQKNSCLADCLHRQLSSKCWYWALEVNASKHSTKILYVFGTQNSTTNTVWIIF